MAPRFAVLREGYKPQPPKTTGPDWPEMPGSHSVI